jgi:bacillithiol biosynthesis deacetylase BshB1
VAVDILAVGAHPDDVEIGMGGALLSFLADGYRVGVLDLTNGEPTPRGSVEQRARERDRAAAILGVTLRVSLDLPNRHLEDTVEARVKVAEVFREHQPRLVFVPYWVDAHPDHLAASSLAEAARFYAKLTRSHLRHAPHYPAKVYSYFCTHLRLHVKPSFILDISAHLARKLEALAAYESQFQAVRPDENLLDWVRRDNVHWGALIGTGAGEPFICREEVGVRTLRGLLP